MNKILSLILICSVVTTVYFFFVYQTTDNSKSVLSVSDQVNPSPTKLPSPTPTISHCPGQPSMKSKTEVMALAAKDGLSISEMKEVGALYDLLCFGETNTNIQEGQPDTAQKEFGSKIKEDCIQEKAEYSTCLTKYNTELIEYQNCQMGLKKFGCGISNTPPSNYCESKISYLCR